MTNIMKVAILLMCLFFSVHCTIACNTSRNSLARIQADTVRALKTLKAHNFSKEQEESCVATLQKNINKLEKIKDENGKIELEIALLRDYISLVHDLRVYSDGPTKEQANRLRELGNTDSTIRPIIEHVVKL